TIRTYVDRLESDDAADVVAELPPTVAAEVLREMPAEDSTEVQELLGYDPETAGGIMGTEFVSVRMNDTIAQAIKEVRSMSKNNIAVHSVYVVDEEGRLVGMIPLQSLVLHTPNRRVYKVMETDVKSVPTDLDQEEVAATFRKYDLVSLPVLNKNSK